MEDAKVAASPAVKLALVVARLAFVVAKLVLVVAKLVLVVAKLVLVVARLVLVVAKLVFVVANPVVFAFTSATQLEPATVPNRAVVQAAQAEEPVNPANKAAATKTFFEDKNTVFFMI